MTHAQAVLLGITAVALMAATKPRTTLDIISDAEAVSDAYTGDPRLLRERQVEMVDVIAMEPKNALAHYALGRIETLLACPGSRRCDERKAKEAMALIDRSLVLDPGLPEGHVGRGWLFHYQGDIWGADEEVRLALELRPGYWRAEYLKARIALSQGKNAEAIEVARRLVARNTENRVLSRAHHVLAMAYSSARQLDLADEHHRASIKAAPTSAWNKGNYADFLLWTNRVDEAIKMAKATIALVNYGAARDTLKRAYRAKAAQLLKKDDARGAEKYTKLADDMKEY